MTSTSSTVLAHPVTDFPKSRIRRKPAFTYKSPSTSDVDPFIVLSTRCGSLIQSQSSSTESGTTKSSKDVGPHKRTATTLPPGRHSLPLYHPMGELALSLPPLDPADFGLPLPLLPGNSSRRSSGRPRRLPSKIRDLDEESELSVSLIAAVAANEVKRASPRKRRIGAINGKRRRRDPDDGDATYPAKRTRQARAGADDDNDLDDVRHEAEGTPEMDGPVEQRPERRSTRSRTKRRGSSEAESLADEQLNQSYALAFEESVVKRSAPEVEIPSEEKEEGELVEGDNAR